MKANRLVQIVLLLQVAGRRTAEQLAEELGVSLRTVYRDIEALQIAGVPVYSDRGPAGGYRLVEGYQTRLTGLTPEEAESLFLTGLPGPAAELGLGTVVAAASLKLKAALPNELRSRAARVWERFQLDVPGWFSESEPVPFLPAIAEAVWSDHRLHLRYQSWGGEVERDLEPLGMVLKAGVWYLVARSDGTVHTYRISRVLELEDSEEHFDRPDDFDLQAFWVVESRSFEEAVYGGRARLLATPAGLERLSVIYGHDFVQQSAPGHSDPVGSEWREIEMAVEESIPNAAAELLRFGPEILVIEPIELRQEIARLSSDIARLYESPGAGD